MKTKLTLKSGRVVVRSLVAFGAINASMEDGGDISETEWQEICGLIREETQQSMFGVRSAGGGIYWEQTIKLEKI